MNDLVKFTIRGVSSREHERRVLQCPFTYCNFLYLHKFPMCRVITVKISHKTRDFDDQRDSVFYKFFYVNVERTESRTTSTFFFFHMITILLKY